MPSASPTQECVPLWSVLAHPFSPNTHTLKWCNALGNFGTSSLCAEVPRKYLNISSPRMFPCLSYGSILISQFMCLQTGKKSFNKNIMILWIHLYSSTVTAGLGLGTRIGEVVGVALHRIRVSCLFMWLPFVLFTSAFLPDAFSLNFATAFQHNFANLLE